LILKAIDPATKFSEIAVDLMKSLYGINRNLVIYPYQTRITLKIAAMGIDKIPKSPGV
jgi:hypothetical protein